MTESLVTFLFEFANFVAFVLLLGWFFYKPVSKYLQEQAERNAMAQRRADEILADAEESKQLADEDRKQFALEMEKQRSTLLKEAQDEADRVLEKTGEEVKRRKMQAETDLDHMKSQQLDELAKVVARATRESVVELLNQIDGPELDAALVKAACQEIRKLRVDRRDPVLIETATELNSEMKTEILKSLESEPEELDVRFELNQELVGGLRVRSSAGLVDLSIQGLAGYAERNMRQELGLNDRF